MNTKTFIMVAWSALLLSCDNLSRSNSEYIPVDDYPITEMDENDGRGYDEYSGTADDGLPNISNIQLTGRIVQCNKCMGYGKVQDGMYGQPEICKFCWVSSYMQGWTGFDGRFGQVDAVFNTLPADYFDGLDWNAGGEIDNNGGASAEHIESEIARHEENISRLEHQLEYIEGSIYRTQIQQQIIEEQYEIRRLEAMRNGM